MSGEDFRLFEFEGYRIDTRERLLRRGNEVISLTPKAVDTLLALLASQGRMVDKETLMTTVWPDTFVEEGALVRNISLLRKTLGKSSADKEFIETIPRRGYRFVAPAIEIPAAEPISEEPAAPAAPEFHPPARRAPGGHWIIKSAAAVAVTMAALWFGWLSHTGAPSVHALAVLPFENLSGDPAQDYFAEGLTEVLISGLTHIAKLQVISLASVSARPAPSQPPAKQALAWHADTVLQCTVLQKGDRVRIHAELIDTRTATVYWSENYERGMDDAWSLQNEVASAIAREIRVKLTPAESQALASSRKIDPRALNAYLRGRYAWNRRTEQQLRTAIDYFNEAIRFQPDNALAYTGLADSYALLASNGTDGMPPNQAMPIAKANARKALELDSALGEAHASLAYILMSWEWNMPEAEKEFRRAIELKPGYATAHQWYSHYLLAAGRVSEAQREMSAAMNLEPLSLAINVGAGWCLYFARRYDEAIEIYRNTLKTDPAFTLAHQTLGMAYGQKQMYADAVAEFRQAVELSNGSPVSIAGLANAYAAAGQVTDARQQVARLEELARHRYVPAVLLANAYRSLGDDQRTYEYIVKGIGERSDYLIYVRTDPALEAIATSPRFLPMFSLLKPLAP